MRITKIVATPLWAPRRQFFGRVMKTAQSAHQPAGADAGVACFHGVVHIHTDHSARGVVTVGVGEVATCWDPDGVELCRMIDSTLAPLLLGKDPMEIAALAALMDSALDVDGAPAKAALEMALFDIVGKYLQTPVYNLLGGRVRDTVRLSHSIPWGSPAEMAAMAAEKQAAGFGTVKCKVGQGLDMDAAVVGAVREAIGTSSKTKLRVDANMGWSTVEEAAANIAALEEYDIELVEQPLPREMYAELAELRALTNVPIMVDESMWDNVSCAKVIQHGSADVANVYVHESGGMLQASRNLAFCEAAGISGMIGSMPELGVGTAAQIHVAMSSTNIKHDCDVCGSLYFNEDYLTAETAIMEGLMSGVAHAPGGVGLGVEVDMDVVKRWSRKPTAPRL
jgi:L-alanine-DL-glutamate epimerase-like enolase superfamily enzyme